VEILTTAGRSFSAKLAKLPGKDSAFATAETIIITKANKAAANQDMQL
jgi:hypothetical protein